MTAEAIGRPVTGAHLQLFAASGSAAVRWRLLGGNHRELGRGVPGYADAESCRLGIKHLQVQADQLVSRVRRNEKQRWIWELTLDGEILIASGHPYDRMIRCEQAVEMFVVAFVDAPVRGDVMVSDARRWNRALGPTCSSPVYPEVASW